MLSLNESVHRTTFGRSSRTGRPGCCPMRRPGTPWVAPPRFHHVRNGTSANVVIERRVSMPPAHRTVLASGRNPSSLFARRGIPVASRAQMGSQPSE